MGFSYDLGHRTRRANDPKERNEKLARGLDSITTPTPKPVSHTKKGIDFYYSLCYTNCSGINNNTHHEGDTMDENGYSAEMTDFEAELMYEMSAEGYEL